MTPLGLGLVLAAAVCHAVWNYHFKRIGGNVETLFLVSLAASALYLPLALHVLHLGLDAPGPLAWGLIVGSALLHTGYFLLLQRGYRNGDLSLVYPTARSTGPVLSAGFAVLVLGEVIGAQAGLGALLVVGGILGLTGGGLARARRAGPSLLYGVATGATIGAYTVWDAHAVAAAAVPPLLLDYGSNLLRTALLLPAALRRPNETGRQWRAHAPRILLVGLLSPLAYILVLQALTFTPVVYVAPLRETSVLLSVLLGSWLLREGDLGRRLGWAAVILVGAALLATG